MKKVIFVSDSKKTISLYREEFIACLESRGIICFRMGLRDLLKGIIKLILAHAIVTSNLRANIAILCLVPFKKKIIILNGIGNADRFFILRWFLIKLIKFQDNKCKVAVQNYRDMRWLRLNGIKAHLIYGSGGRDLGVSMQASDNRTVIISRPGKILLQENSIKKYMDEFPDQMIEGIGFTQKDTNISNAKINFQGFINPSKFFKSSKVFFQPHGYSEGTPHTLVDALCSGCLVIMEKKTFLFLGLTKIYTNVKSDGDFVTIPIDKYYAMEFFGIDKITKQYVNLLVS